MSAMTRPIETPEVRALVANMKAEQLDKLNEHLGGWVALGGTQTMSITHEGHYLCRLIPHGGSMAIHFGVGRSAIDALCQALQDYVSQIHSNHESLQ